MMPSDLRPGGVSDCAWCISLASVGSGINAARRAAIRLPSLRVVAVFGVVGQQRQEFVLDQHERIRLRVASFCWETTTLFAIADGSGQRLQSAAAQVRKGPDDQGLVPARNTQSADVRLRRLTA